MLRIAVFGALLMTSSVPASAQVLWNGIKAGMSRADAMRAVPQLRAAEDGRSLIMEGVPVMGSSFKAFVNFEGEAVTSVALVGSGPSFADVSSGLTQKYGQPSAPRSCTSLGGGIRICNQDWMGQLMKISVMEMSKYERASITVTYAPMEKSML